MSQTNHLIRRGGTWYYRRRVPTALLQSVGADVIQFSLKTADLKEAKKRRAAEDLKWATRVEIAQSTAKQPSGSQEASKNAWQSLPEQEVVRLVQEYVERTDEQASQVSLVDPPTSEEERVEIKTDIEIGLGILKSRDDPRADEFIYHAGKNILVSVGRSIDDETGDYAAFAEWVRRGLVELQRRKLGRISDDHGHAFFDQAFDPRRPPRGTFQEVAEQFIRVTEDEATVNRTSQKWVDKQRANVALLREVIGNDTPVSDVDYDACLRVRGLLARLPANRNKLYEGLSLDEAVAKGIAEKKPTLSPVTQGQYLQTLKGILDLAARKRMIPVNPAEDMRPLKRDTITPSEKRRPFTPEQLKMFFEGAYYRACAQHQPPYAHDKEGWRFWLPLLCLFMGMRPNEAAQMHAADVRQTEQGTWYVDVVASADDAEELPNGKVLKTGASRRRIPVHPELVSIGFLDFACEQRKKGQGMRLFPHLKPDNYGNHAKYPLKRFRETYLPQAITLQPRQSFYSFRHNFRDGLRSIGAPADALQALGGWSQGKLVSDDYGSKANPDYQSQFVQKMAFSGLSLTHLHVLGKPSPSAENTMATEPD